MVMAVSQQTFIYVSEILIPCTSSVMKFYYFFFQLKSLKPELLDSVQRQVAGRILP